MKITVLGAAGKMATGAIRDLAESDEVTEMVLVDLKPCKPLVEERAKRWCHNKASVVSADINDADNFRAAIRGSAALANCTTHHLNLKVMDACHAENVNYVDMGGLFHVAKKQLQLNSRWREKGLTAVLGMGSAPGMDVDRPLPASCMKPGTLTTSSGSMKLGPWLGFTCPTR